MRVLGLLFVIPLIFTMAFPAAANSGATPATAPVAASYGPRPSDIHLIGNDNGGSVVGYARAVQRLRRQDTLIVFDGRCASACTLYLSLQNTRTCLMPGASFLFHRAYGARRDMNEWATGFMMDQYPAWVQAWVRGQGGLTDRVIRMDYDYAARFMRTCRTAST
ncbi:MAG: hypothetical protein ACOCY0_03455 [Roseicyclus sp.]